MTTDTTYLFLMFFLGVIIGKIIASIIINYLDSNIQ